jgi:ADP-dependent NAD(P)H-hydrate dehydratase / NAD(P)H-hydrate epimerase
MSEFPAIPKRNQVFTVQQSRELDRATIEEFGIDGFTLMEIAARGAADCIRRQTGDGRKGLFICGKGNNAGDALAAARCLAEDANHEILITMILGDNDLSPDAARNLKLLEKIAEVNKRVRFAEHNEVPEFHDFDYIADGIFGTGLQSEVREPVAEWIRSINRSERPVFAMDLPSGLDVDSGNALGVCVKATFTCTFGTQKPGFYLNQARQYTGKIEYIDLPFPNYLKPKPNILADEGLFDWIPSPVRSAKHKYDRGVVHLVAGSEGLTGAAIMAAKAAWKEGAGAVLLYCPEELLEVYETTLPNVIKIPLKSRTHYQPSDLEPVLDRISGKPGTLVAGPGVGLHRETGTFITELFKNYKGPAVIDADALSVWDQLKTLPESARAGWILTPHSGEASNYLGLKFSDDHDRLKKVHSFATKWNVSLLMKGNPTIYSYLGETACITAYDCSPFTRAGFGDVLAGTIAAYRGLTGSAAGAPVMAILQGYRTYLNRHDPSTFGPEHLL